MKIDKKNYPQVYQEQCKYKIKKKRLVDFTDDELHLNTDDSDGSECNFTERLHLTVYWGTFLNL